jgi:hypothetical protein
MVFRLFLLILFFFCTTAPSWAENDPETNPEIRLLEERLQELEASLKRMQEENEARRTLQSTAEEKAAQEEEILSAAGRDYTLMRPGRMGFEYNFRYSYYSYDQLVEAGKIEHKSNHNIENSMVVEYPLKPNLTLSADFPFVFKSDNKSSDGSSRQVSDIGDFVLGFQYQPLKSGGKMPTTILSLRASLPVGRSPYDIDPDKEMATSSGTYSLTAGANFSKVFDPIIAYGGLSYSYYLPESTRYHAKGVSSPEYVSEVNRGEQFGFSAGFGYALSYRLNINLSYQYSLSMRSKYTWTTDETPEKWETQSPTSASSVFSIGTGWRISSKRTMNVRLGIGLTNNDPDFTLAIRLPFELVF